MHSPAPHSSNRKSASSRAAVGTVSTGAVAWAVVALIAASGFGALMRFGIGTGPLPVDLWWHDLVSVTRGSPMYAVAVALADIGGSVGAAACTAIAAALLLVLGRRRDAGAVVFAMGAGVLVSELLKLLIMRTRPSDQLYQATGQSYPSGHSVGAAALAVSLALVVAGLGYASHTVVRSVWLVAVCWALLMMWSRTALHVHWLTDTVAGALLGTAMAFLSRRLWVRGVTSMPAVPRRV